ncbi:MAG: hypothetical protein JWN66_4230 [Sphingomonas bacterium]|uniref:hypothetical protein n=1 Tax=Sphingomonas bacterium TaxID=1895847 RepID=UPI002617BA16|nr:hypothetical protein [Sphingomonas bacterium]MDB5707114.1 hypothetical protein [Sphingomonas bacterium]
MFTIPRLGGVAAILAGILRAVLIGVPLTTLGPSGLETLYLAIDLAILLGLVGLAVKFGHWLGLWGLIGLIVAAAGLLIIRTGDRTLVPAAYQSGAALLAIGMAAMSAPLLRAPGIGRIAAALLIASPVAGIIGAAAGSTIIASDVATALFSAGLIALGLTLLRSNAPAG